MLNTTMAKVLIIGCGDLGGELASQLVRLGVETIGVRRSGSPLDGVVIIQADVTQTVSLEAIKSIEPEILVYCVAANGQTDEQYKAHYVDGLRHVLETQQANLKLKHVFFVSSTRVYGQKTYDFLDENDEALPCDFGGERLLEAEALLNTLTCSHTVLRLSGIYGAGRLRMINLAKSTEKWPVQNSWTNRIHRDDAAAFMVFLVMQALEEGSLLIGGVMSSCFIVTDSRPVTQHEVLHWIANQLHINPPTKVSSSIHSGKRLSNKAMLATGFKLKYPNYQAGYQALLSGSSQT